MPVIIRGGPGARDVHYHPLAKKAEHQKKTNPRKKNSRKIKKKWKMVIRMKTE